MPKVACQYLLDILLEVGPTLQGAMGPVPLTELELLAYQLNRRYFLQPWEAKFILRLSKEFAAMHGVAEEDGCPAPWAQRLAPAEARLVTRSLFDEFRAPGS